MMRHPYIPLHFREMIFPLVYIETEKCSQLLTRVGSLPLANYDDDDDTKFVKSRLAVFSHGELTVRMNLLGACIARDGPDSSYLGVWKA